MTALNAGNLDYTAQPLGSATCWPMSSLAASSDSSAGFSLFQAVALASSQLFSSECRLGSPASLLSEGSAWVLLLTLSGKGS